jgi:hypothetical protein
MYGKREDYRILPHCGLSRKSGIGRNSAVGYRVHYFKFQTIGTVTHEAIAIAPLV